MVLVGVERGWIICVGWQIMLITGKKKVILVRNKMSSFIVVFVFALN